MTAELRPLRFLLNDDDVVLDRVAPEATLLDFLRLERRLCGAKEGCCAGECGACTVLVGRFDGAAPRYVPVASCIRLLGSLHAQHVVTVERLAQGGAPHPIQQALIDEHGSQCGYCAPGVVMALYALMLEGGALDDRRIDRALQGNLCRCTGYASFARAARSAAAALPNEEDRLVRERDAIAARLRGMAEAGAPDTEAGDDGVERAWSAPSTIAELKDAMARRKGATLVAGGGDVALAVKKALRPIAPAIFLSGVAELRRVEEREDGLVFGAAAPYRDVAAAILARWPEAEAYWSRIGGPQIQATGTLGGAVVSAAPTSDAPPLLIALEASATLMGRRGKRTIALESFFLGHGRVDLRADEFVESFKIPARRPGARLRAYKVAKRRHGDVAIAGLAARIDEHHGRIYDARLAFSGMASEPRRADRAERALRDKPFARASFEDAAAALAGDFAPPSDARASAAYRELVAANLLRRFFLDEEAARAPAGEAA